MHVPNSIPPFSFPSSSSLPIHQFGMTATSTVPYASHSMSSFSSSTSLPQYEHAGSSEGEDEAYDLQEDSKEIDQGRGHGDEDQERRDSRGSSNDQKDGIQKRKPRITLARGGACVVCRNRKLKCTGERPCRSCVKAGTECRYEEIQRRKPKAQLMDERMAHLESMLGLAPGEPIQNIGKRAGPVVQSLPIQIPGGPMLAATSISTSPLSSATPPITHSGPPPLNLHCHRDITSQGTGISTTPRFDILPNSQLESALINLVLPHTPYLSMPLHPQRFLALLSLPAHDPSRPHPALLYILFAEAVLILERQTPPPKSISPPMSLFSNIFTPVMPPPPVDRDWLLNHVRGMSLSLLERARVELDNGIRNVDRPFDLARASIGIARHLFALGRFIEGWNVPVSRLVISCGLHRLTGNHFSTDGSFVQPASTINPLPKPYAPAHHYVLANQHMTAPGGLILPILRMRPVILPPARDEIDVAERTATFWAAKMQDWEAGCGWGWTTSMADEECTTQWPWGWGVPEPKSSMSRPDDRYGIRDLHEPASMAHQSLFPDTTYTLALKSLALLHRASHLFDLPISSIATPQPDGRLAPTHIPPLASIQAIETSINQFRARIPSTFAYNHGTSGSNTPSDGMHTEVYDGFNDPWWIMLHTNLYTAEVMMWKETAHYQAAAYSTAVGCARAMVAFVAKIRPDQWTHVDMGVVITISLCSRFLFKESDRLQTQGEVQGATMAADEAEILRQALTGEYSRWLPMASLHGLIVQRVREGWAEKEGEYERI